MDWELSLRTTQSKNLLSKGTHNLIKNDHLPEIPNALAHHPSIDKEYRSVRLSLRLVKVERDHGVDIFGNIQVEGRHEEADTCGAVWQALGEVARCPALGGEAGEVPTLSFAEQTSFVEDTTDFVWEAGGRPLEKFLWNSAEGGTYFL